MNAFQVILLVLLRSHLHKVHWPASLQPSSHYGLYPLRPFPPEIGPFARQMLFISMFQLSCTGLP